MSGYSNIPTKYLNQLAKSNKVKYRGRTSEEVVEELAALGKSEDLNYLNEQFKFPSSYLSILKAESNFPDKSQTPEDFISALVAERVIITEQINAEWQPALSSNIKICALKHDGSSVYLKLVEERIGIRKRGYSKESSSYAHFTSAVIHFGEDELIELRCASREVKKYAEFIMKLMGFGSYKWVSVPKLTKEAAKELCSLLSAGVASTHIALPATVGSLQFNGKKGVNLSRDNTFTSITNAIQGLGLPTDDTMDEKCFFSFSDPRTNIVIEATFEVNIKSSYFKFTTNVPEVVVDHVLDTLVRVSDGQISAAVDLTVTPTI